MFTGAYCQSSSAVYHLNPKSWPTQTIDLSNVISDIRIIPLETKPDCLIGDINDFLQNEQGIFLLAHHDEIIHFDRTGRFIWKIKRVGRGPGEYAWLSGFTIRDNEIILMDNRGRKLLFYTLKGDFIREIPQKKSNFSIAPVNDNLIAIYHGRCSGVKGQMYQLTFLDKEGNLLKSLFPFEKLEMGDMFSGFTYGMSANSVLFHKIFDPVIFQISGAGVDTLLRFDFGLPPVNSFKEMGDATQFIGIRGIANTKTILAAKFQAKSGPDYVWLLDHQSGNTKILASEYNAGLGNYHGFPVQSPVWSNREEFVICEDAVDIKEIISKIEPANLEYLRKNIPGFSSLEKLKEDDNPVLILYKVKDF